MVNQIGLKQLLSPDKFSEIYSMENNTPDTVMRIKPEAKFLESQLPKLLSFRDKFCTENSIVEPTLLRSDVSRYFSKTTSTYGNVTTFVKFVDSLFDNINVAISESNLEYIKHVSIHINRLLDAIHRKTLLSPKSPNRLHFEEMDIRDFVKQHSFFTLIQSTETLTNIHSTFSDFNPDKYGNTDADIQTYQGNDVTYTVGLNWLAKHITMGFSILGLIKYEKGTTKKVVDKNTKKPSEDYQEPSTEIFEHFIRNGWIIIDSFCEGYNEPTSKPDVDTLELFFNLITRENNVEKLKIFYERYYASVGKNFVLLPSLSLPKQIFCRFFEHFVQNFHSLFLEDHEAKCNIVPFFFQPQIPDSHNMYNVFNVGLNLFEKSIEMYTKKFHGISSVSSHYNAKFSTQREKHDVEYQSKITQWENIHERNLTFLESILKFSIENNLLSPFLLEISELFGDSIMDFFRATCEYYDDYVNSKDGKIAKMTINKEIFLRNVSEIDPTIFYKTTKKFNFNFLLMNYLLPVVNHIMKKHCIKEIPQTLLGITNAHLFSKKQKKLLAESNGKLLLTRQKPSGALVVNRDVFVSAALKHSISNRNCEALELTLKYVFSSVELYNIGHQTYRCSTTDSIETKELLLDNVDDLICGKHEYSSTFSQHMGRNSINLLQFSNNEWVKPYEMGKFDIMFGKNNFWDIGRPNDDGYLPKQPSNPLAVLSFEKHAGDGYQLHSITAKHHKDPYLSKTVRMLGNSNSIHQDVVNIYNHFCILKDFINKATNSLNIRNTKSFKRLLTKHYCDSLSAKDFVTNCHLDDNRENTNYLFDIFCVSNMGLCDKNNPLHKNTKLQNSIPKTDKIVINDEDIFPHNHHCFGIFFYELCQPKDYKNATLSLPLELHDILMHSISTLETNGTPSLESMINSKIIVDEYEWHSIPRDKKDKILPLNSYEDLHLSKIDVVLKYINIPKILEKFALRQDSLLSRSIYSLKISSLPQLVTDAEYKLILEKLTSYELNKPNVWENTSPFKLKMFEYFTTCWINFNSKVYEQPSVSPSYSEYSEFMHKDNPTQNIPMMFGVHQKILFYFMLKNTYNSFAVQTTRMKNIEFTLQQKSINHNLHCDLSSLLLEMCKETDITRFTLSCASFKDRIEHFRKRLTYYVSSLLSQMGHKNMAFFKSYGNIFFKNWMISGLEKLIHIINITLLLRQFSFDSDENNPVNAYNFSKMPQFPNLAELLGYDKKRVDDLQVALISMENIQKSIRQKNLVLNVLNTNLFKRVHLDPTRYDYMYQRESKFAVVKPHKFETTAQGNSLSNYMISSRTKHAEHPFLKHVYSQSYQVEQDKVTVPKIIIRNSQWKGSPFFNSNFGESMLKLTSKSSEPEDITKDIESVLTVDNLDKGLEQNDEEDGMDVDTQIDEQLGLVEDSLSSRDSHTMTGWRLMHRFEMDENNEDENKIEESLLDDSPIKKNRGGKRRLNSKIQGRKGLPNKQKIPEMEKRLELLKMLSKSSHWSLPSEFSISGTDKKGYENVEDEWIVPGLRTFMTFTPNRNVTQLEHRNRDQIQQPSPFWLSPTMCEQVFSQEYTSCSNTEDGSFLLEGDISNSRDEISLDKIDFLQDAVGYLEEIEIERFLERILDRFVVNGIGEHKETVLKFINNELKNSRDNINTILNVNLRDRQYHEHAMVAYLVSNLGLMFSKQTKNLYKFTGFEKYQCSTYTTTKKDHHSGPEKPVDKDFLRSMFEEEFLQLVFGGPDVIMLADYALKHVNQDIKNRFFKFVHVVIHKRWSCAPTSECNQNIAEAFLLATSLITDLQNVSLKYSDASFCCNFPEEVKSCW